MSVFRGSEDEILTVLWGLSMRDVINGEHSNSAEVAAEAMSAAIEGGEPIITTAYLGRFEVVAPQWSLVQDVYGCEHGRACPDITDEERAKFESMIAKRLAEQEGQG